MAFQKRLSSSDGLSSLSAQALNEVFDSAKLSLNKGRRIANAQRSFVRAIAKNVSGYDYKAGAPVVLTGFNGDFPDANGSQLDDNMYDPFEPGYYTFSEVYLPANAAESASLPSGSWMHTAITLEPIANNAFGWIATSGIVQAKVRGATPGLWVMPNVTASGEHREYATVSSEIGFGIVLAKTGVYDRAWIALGDPSSLFVYQLTADWVDTSQYCAGKFASGSTLALTLRDPNLLARWQLNGDKGLARVNGAYLDVIVPFCNSDDQPDTQQTIGTGGGA